MVEKMKKIMENETIMNSMSAYEKKTKDKI
jgi:hypothetical protein